MKRSLLIISIAAGWFQAVQAQKPDSAKLMVHYKYAWVRDTTTRDKPYTEQMILFAGNNASAYKSYDRKLQNDLLRKQVAEQMAANGPGGGPISIKRTNANITNNELYMFQAQNKMVRKENLVTNSYLISEPLPQLNWKISTDTLSLGGMLCQKATTHFAGRDYIAWFCPDLPFHAGPWKLNGLPGIILEAYDVKKDVVFKFDGIEDPSKFDKPTPGTDANTISTPGNTRVMMFGMGDINSDPTVIALPSNGIPTTDKEFNKLKEAMRKDPQAFMQSAMAASGIKLAQTSGGTPSMKVNVQTASGPVINNPVELPEKK